jgi:cation diffusion facilitator CzcD-associated flavoprotein CzcO
MSSHRYGKRYWNCYPGARVDSQLPIYQLFDKELWDGWTFKQRYPGREELREYFNYLDNKLDLKRNIQFNTACTGAVFDEQANQWVIHLDNGSEVRARWFIAAVGFAAKPYIPNYPGLDKYQGKIYHTSVRVLRFLITSLPCVYSDLVEVATRRSESHG